MLTWDDITTLKLVKVGLTDAQFKLVLKVLKDKLVETLVVTNNELTEAACLEIIDM